MAQAAGPWTIGWRKRHLAGSSNPNTIPPHRARSVAATPARIASGGRELFRFRFRKAFLIDPISMKPLASTQCPAPTVPKMAEPGCAVRPRIGLLLHAENAFKNPAAGLGLDSSLRIIELRGLDIVRRASAQSSGLHRDVRAGGGGHCIVGQAKTLRPPRL